MSSPDVSRALETHVAFREKHPDGPGSGDDVIGATPFFFRLRRDGVDSYFEGGCSYLPPKLLMKQDGSDRSCQVKPCKLKLLDDRVAIIQDDAEESSKGGILLPDVSKEKPQRGVVAAVGPGKVNDNGVLVPMVLEVGDRVLFGRWAGNECKVGEETYMVQRESDVLAVVEDGEETDHGPNFPNRKESVDQSP